MRREHAAVLAFIAEQQDGSPMGAAHAPRRNVETTALTRSIARIFLLSVPLLATRNSQIQKAPGSKRVPTVRNSAAVHSPSRGQSLTVAQVDRDLIALPTSAACSTQRAQQRDTRHFCTGSGVMKVLLPIYVFLRRAHGGANL